MPFPHSEREIYGRNPLEEVVCQLRFPAILEIAAEQPAKFQNKVRRQYPLFEIDRPGISPDIPWPKEIAEFIGKLPVAQSAGDATYKFLTEDSNRFISLTS